MEELIERADKLAEQCNICKNAKKQKQTQCLLWYAAVSKRYPDVLKDLDRYLDKDGVCKGFENGEVK